MRKLYKVRQTCQELNWVEIDWYIDLDKSWSNLLCGQRRKSSSDEILDVTEAVDFIDLDWRGTWMDSKDFEKYHAGWLDPNGNYYGCNEQHLNKIAVYLLKRTIKILEKEGWVKITNAEEYFIKNGDLTLAQIDWLKAHGYKITQ